MTENLQRLATMGEQAQQLLDNPAFEEMWNRMRDEIQQAWVGCDVRDTEGQRLLLQQAKLVERMKNTVRGMVEQGKMANAKIPIDGLLNEGPIRRSFRAVAGR